MNVLKIMLYVCVIILVISIGTALTFTELKAIERWCDNESCIVNNNRECVACPMTCNVTIVNVMVASAIVS